MSDEDYGEFDERYFIEPDEPNPPTKLPEDDFEQERRDLLDRIDKYEELIEQRKTMLYKNLETITDESLIVSAEIEHIKQTDWADKSRLDGLTKLLFQFEQQKRTEKTSAWHDVWALLKEMLTTMDDYNRFMRAGRW